METRAEMENELKERLQATANSGMYSASRLTELIQNAYSWATSLFTWSSLVKAMTTSSQEDKYYYDYPEEFKTNSIFRLEIDGDSYDKKNYEDYLDYKLNYPTTTEKKIFADHARWFFIFPTSPAYVSNNIDVWGMVEADPLSSSLSTTIFSNNTNLGNEAIVRKGFADGIRRLDNTLAKAEEDSAIALLQKVFEKEQINKQRDKRLQHPKWDVPDFFKSGSSSPIGRFSYDPRRN